MNKSQLCNVEGEKIRHQYFTGIIWFFLFCMLIISYSMFVFPLMAGNFDLSKWLSNLLMTFGICFCFSIPFIILAVLNRCYFGKIVCVLNNKGLNYKDGIIKWDEINTIEYEINIPIKVYRKMPFCNAVIYTNNANIVLVHAPLFIISKVKKYSPNIETCISDKSKWRIALIIGLYAVIAPLVPVFR